MTIAPGEGVILYTDGLVERREEAIDVGLARLADAANRQRPTTPSAAHSVLDAVVGDMLRGYGSGDDVCAVILGRLPENLPLAPPRTTVAAPAVRAASRTLHPRPQAAGEARRLVSAWLAEWGLRDVEDVAVLVISEMVTNAVTHAEGLITVTAAAADDGLLRLTVMDGSHAVPRLERASPAAEHGRGVDLVDMLSQRWGTEHLPVGKRVWAELKAT